MRRRLVPILLLLAACTAGPSPEDVASPVQERMFRHFALARDLRTLSVSADLERLAVTARELAELDETWGMPPGSDAYLEMLREAANRAARTAEQDDARGATRAAADVARVCGDCHVAMQARLGGRFQTVAPYMDDDAVRHQNYLSWASRLLWDGLVGPSERTWQAGGEALAAEEGYPLPRGDAVTESAHLEAARHLRLLGEEARSADTSADRARVVAAVWLTCGGCHLEAGVR